MSKMGNYLMQMSEEALYLEQGHWVEKFGVGNLHVFESVNGVEHYPSVGDLLENSHEDFWEFSND